MSDFNNMTFFENADLRTKVEIMENSAEKYTRNEGFKTVDSYEWERNDLRHFGQQVAIYSILAGLLISGCICILKMCIKRCERQSFQEYQHRTIDTPPPRSSNQCNYFNNL